VTATEQRDERESDLLVLADDDALDVGDDLLAGLLDLRHQLPLLSDAGTAKRPATGDGPAVGSARCREIVRRGRTGGSGA